MEINERLKEELKILKQTRHDLVEIGANFGTFWLQLQNRIEVIEILLQG